MEVVGDVKVKRSSEEKQNERIVKKGKRGEF